MTNTAEHTHKSNSKNGMKHTKIGWIPEEWEVLKIEDIFKNLKTYSFSRKALTYEKGLIQYIHYGDIHSKFENTVLNLEGLRMPKVKPSVKLPKDITFLQSGDIVLTDASEDFEGLGKAIELENAKHQLIAGLHTFALRDCQEFTSPGFRGYFFKSKFVRKRIKEVSTGVKVQGLSKKNLFSLEIPFPPKPEQKAIAKCLGLWDTAIAKQRQLINAQKTRQKALAQQLLTGKTRLPGFDGEWGSFKFSETAERIKRKNSEENDNVVTISAQRGFVLQETFFTKRVASKTLLNYTLVEKGEFCYNKSYSKGYPKGAFKRLDNLDKAVVTTLYICFRIRDDFNSNFMKYFFEAGKMNRELTKIAQEGGRAHGLLNIGINDFFSMKITLPNLKEQTAIAEVLEKAEREIDLSHQKLAQLQAQKKGLMQQLLTGKKRLGYDHE